MEPGQNVPYSSMENRVPGQFVVQEDVGIVQEIEQGRIQRVEEGNVATEESPDATILSVGLWCDISWRSTVNIQRLDLVCDRWDDLYAASIVK